jgi:hypothetical protein
MAAIMPLSEDRVTPELQQLYSELRDNFGGSPTRPVDQRRVAGSSDPSPTMPPAQPEFRISINLEISGRLCQCLYNLAMPWCLSFRGNFN